MGKDLNCRESKRATETDSKTTILLVDEDPKIGAVFQEFFHDFFKSNEYQMIQATTLSDALAYLEQEKIGLIITDLRLSQYSGLSLLIRVRTMPYEVPIIVMSAYTDFISEEDWKLLGAAEFISKPPDLSRLREVVSRVLKKSTEHHT